MDMIPNFQPYAAVVSYDGVAMDHPVVGWKMGRAVIPNPHSLEGELVHAHLVEGFIEVTPYTPKVSTMTWIPGG